MSPSTTVLTLVEIDEFAKTYAAARTVVSERVTALEEELLALKRRRIAGIKSAAGEAEAAQSQLRAAIERNPELFLKPRTFTCHGIKLGFQKGKGKDHKKEEWLSVIVFVSTHDSLDKARVKYLESHLLAEAVPIGRFNFGQKKAGGAALREHDRAAMESFLVRIRLLLPFLNCDILVPIPQTPVEPPPSDILFCRIKGAEARGQRATKGIVVLQGSTAVLSERISAKRYPSAIAQRRRLIDNGTLIVKDGFLVFTKGVEFSSLSGAAAVIHGGSANGLREWKTYDGKSLKQLD